MLQFDGLDMLAVLAYTPDKKFHPAASGWLGYVFTLGGVTYLPRGGHGLPGFDGDDPL